MHTLQHVQTQTTGGAYLCVYVYAQYMRNQTKHGPPSSILHIHPSNANAKNNKTKTQAGLDAKWAQIRELRRKLVSEWIYIYILYIILYMCVCV